MKQTITLDSKEIATAVRDYLTAKGYDVKKVTITGETIVTGRMDEGRETVVEAEVIVEQGDRGKL